MGIAGRTPTKGLFTHESHPALQLVIVNLQSKAHIKGRPQRPPSKAHFFLDTEYAQNSSPTAFTNSKMVLALIAFPL